jgi:colicin import membrane protein
VLAIAVHAAFFSLIFFGVSWQSQPTPAVEVELWDKLPAAPKAAASVEPPKPVEPPPEPPKPVEPPPEPPKPVEVKPPPPEEVKPPPPKPEAEIAEKLEREKKERLEREAQQRAEAKKREEDEGRKKAEAKKREEDEARKKAEAKKREEDEARKKAEAEKREEEKRRREEELARQEAERAAQAAASARQAEIDKWVNGIKVKIRSRANIPDTVRGNPEVHVLIRVLPGGEVLDITVTKRSGNPAYDNAIERGIRSASPLPVPPPNSELFPQFRELNLQIRHER